VNQLRAKPETSIALKAFKMVIAATARSNIVALFVAFVASDALQQCLRAQ